MMTSKETVISGNRAMCRSYAKINLTLDVTGKRSDGYHEIKTIMQTVNLFDLIIVDKCDSEIKITTNKKFLPTNNKNIAYAACEEFFRTSGLRGGARIFIHKNIPIAAGLAGGSGNGAAVLSALNLLYSEPFSDDELKKLALKLGADVPYCMTGGTQLAEGIGEILTPLTPMPDCYVLLVTPPVSVSTAKVYSDFDNTRENIFVDTRSMLKAISNGDFAAICKNLSNTLESVTIPLHPVIGGIKQKLIGNGAVGAIMSGSGATVFGLFDDYKKAKASHDSFSMMYKDVFLTSIKKNV